MLSKTLQMPESFAVMLVLHLLHTHPAAVSVQETKYRTGLINQQKALLHMAALSTIKMNGDLHKLLLTQSRRRQK